MKNFTVSYSGDVFENVVNVLRGGWPNERGGFLVGDIPGKRDVYTVDDVYFPKKQNGTRTEWYIYHNELVKAHAYASSKGKVVIGFCHSHCHKTFCDWFTCQSHADVDVQIKYNFTLSLVIGCTEKKFSWDTWLRDHPAPLHTRFLDNDGKSWALTKWIKNQKANPFWKELIWGGSTS